LSFRRLEITSNALGGGMKLLNSL